MHFDLFDDPSNASLICLLFGELARVQFAGVFVVVGYLDKIELHT
jgi:hypothetical protein